MSGWRSWPPTVVLISLVLSGMVDAHQVAPPFTIPRAAAKWRSTVIREVRHFCGWDCDPAERLAQLHQESGFTEDAQSRFALGIAQFTPSTATIVQRGFSQDLKELCREKGGCPLDAKWSIRAMVLFMRDITHRVVAAADPHERRAFALVGYNGGEGWTRRERSKCNQQVGCDSGRWFGHVERFCLRAQWACDESRGYPRRILLTLLHHYQDWLRR